MKQEDFVKKFSVNYKIHKDFIRKRYYDIKDFRDLCRRFPGINRDTLFLSLDGSLSIVKICLDDGTRMPKFAEIYPKQHRLYLYLAQLKPLVRISGNRLSYIKNLCLKQETK